MSTESAIAVPSGVEKIAPFDHALRIATVVDAARTTPASAARDGPDLIALCKPATPSAPRTGNATTERATAPQDSPDSSVLSPPAPLLARAMASALLLAIRCSVCATRVTRDMTALKSHAERAIVQVTDSASTESALVKTDGVELIALADALVMDSAAVETESVLRANATATPVGLVTLVTSALACTTAPSTGIAATGPVFARRDTAAVTAPFLPSHSHASAPSIACEVACSSAPRCTRPKGPGRPTSATPSALRSVSLSASLERCPLIFQVPQAFPPSRLIPPLPGSFRRL